MGTSFKRPYACTTALSASSPAAGHRWPMPPLMETHGHLCASLGQSLVGSLLLSTGSWCTQGSVCAFPESASPILCKFWWVYGGVNSDLLQEGLCCTQVYCTQSPCPCGSPLPTRTSTGDAQTQFCLSLCGVSGSWCKQGLFEPSEDLWWAWGLILNVISALLLSCWGSLALDVGYLLKVTPMLRSRRSSTYHLVGASLLLYVGYLLKVALVPRSCLSSIAQPPLLCLPSSWGFSALGHGVSPQSRSSSMQSHLQDKPMERHV